MRERLTSILMPPVVARHYRPVIFALVLLNTALIVFLVVYIWTYGQAEELRGPSAARAESGEQLPRMVVTAVERLPVWDRAGGERVGGAGRGMLAKGDSAPVLERRMLDGELWYELGLEGHSGWVPARGVRDARLAR